MDQIQFEVRHHELYCHIKSYGDRNNSNELFNGTDQLYDIILQCGYPYVIADYSDVVFTLNFPDVFNIIRYYERKLPSMKGITMAGVVNEKNMEIALYWEKLSNIKGYEFKVFVSLEDAVQWITEKRNMVEDY